MSCEYVCKQEESRHSHNNSASSTDRLYLHKNPH